VEFRTATFGCRPQTPRPLPYRGNRFKGSREGPWCVTYDHAIPLRELRSQILALADQPKALLAFLTANVLGVIITNEENDRLNKSLRSSMPPGAPPNDLMARYRAAGIEFEADDIARILQRAS
jgi:hypothetical protein